MDILDVSRSIFQPFDALSGAHSVAGDNEYILTPTASVSSMDFAVDTDGVGRTYIFTPSAQAGFLRSVSASSTYIMTPSDGAVSTFAVEAVSTYIFTPDAVSPFVDRVAGVGIGDDVPTYIFTSHGSATVDWRVTAASTYIFTPDSSERHVETGNTDVTYIFTPHASSAKEFLGESDATYIFTPQADSHIPNPHRDVGVTYIFEVACDAVVVALDCTPLGRYRRGDVVPVELTLSYIPDQAPLVLVLDNDDEVIEAFSMGRSVNDPGTFDFDLFMGPSYQQGRYILVFTVLAGGIQFKQRDQCFGVVGGGDAGGPVISLVCYQRGRNQSVLAHLGNGELVLGRNPSLDYTPPSLISPVG